MDAEPVGAPIDRSCKTVADCKSTCQLGPVSSAWRRSHPFHDCKDGCDFYKVECFEGMCAPSQAIVGGKLNRAHECLKMTHLPPSMLYPAEAPSMKPKLYVVLDVKRAASLGITPNMVRDALERAFYSIRDTGDDDAGMPRRFSILSRSNRILEVDALLSLVVSGDAGTPVRLQDVASVETAAP